MAGSQGEFESALGALVMRKRRVYWGEDEMIEWERGMETIEYRDGKGEENRTATECVDVVVE